MSPIEPPQNLLEHLRQGNRFLLTGHLNPDGDSIGSALGLSRLLAAIGKSTTIWNLDPTPAIYRMLPGAERIHEGAEPPTSDLSREFDMVVTIECPSLSRCGLEEWIEALPVLNLDHHLGNENYGVANWVDSAAPALGEMILRLGRALGVPLSAEAATLLLVALVSDTGGFRFANATERAFDAAAQLVRAGAEPTKVSRWLYESRPRASLLLLREMLGSLEITEDGRVASVLLTRRMFRQSGATPAHSEGLINYPRSIDGVDAVVLVRELESGDCKVSLRSHGELNVERIARAHGGGGHRNAAGFLAEGDLEDVRKMAIAKVQGARKRDAG